MHPHHLKRTRGDFPFGLTPITDLRDPTGIGFSILKLHEGEHHRIQCGHECALLLMTGQLNVQVGQDICQAQRSSLFDQAPFSCHVDAHTEIQLQALSDVEVALFEVSNSQTFSPEFYSPEDTSNEPRGEGLVGNQCLRHVRTIFDDANSHPHSQLVLGEVINFPGRWSSYPPHHHPQPEIYHYRFSHPQGYGHGELGEEVLKVRHGDTVRILDEMDHSQCSAPGYAMYYIWVIRHLPQQRYSIPQFTPEHTWTMDSSAVVWSPQEEEVLV